MIAAVGDAALGAQAASFWTAALNNPVNARFVADFEKKYNRLPSFYAAAGFDTALLLDNAIRTVGGKVSDRRVFRKAIAEAQFDAARGRFKFNTNHIPLSDFYSRPSAGTTRAATSWRWAKIPVGPQGRLRRPVQVSGRLTARDA